MHEKAGLMNAEHWNLPHSMRLAIGYHHAVYNLNGQEGSECGFRLTALINLSDIMARILQKGRPFSDINLFELPACQYLGIEEDESTITFFKPIPDILLIAFHGLYC